MWNTPGTNKNFNDSPSQQLQGSAKVVSPLAVTKTSLQGCSVTASQAAVSSWKHGCSDRLELGGVEGWNNNRKTEKNWTWVLKCSATWKKHHEMWIKINLLILVMTSQNQQKTQGESPPIAILAIIYSYQVSYGKALEVAAVGASNGKPRLFK